MKNITLFGFIGLKISLLGPQKKKKSSLLDGLLEVH